MFEVNGTYANRRGEYVVLAIDPPLMTVRYKDGSEAELKIDLQARIWDNIAAEYEAREASRSARAARRGIVTHEANYYIKIISVPAVDEMGFPGWQERVVMAPPEASGTELKAGDRIIFYAIETQTFFAVATITGEPAPANPKEYFFTINADSVDFFPIDIDAAASTLEKGAHIDSVELESQPRFKRLRLTPESFVAINEDDFELLSEALTEVAEDEDEEEEDEEEAYEEDDE